MAAKAAAVCTIASSTSAAPSSQAALALPRTQTVRVRGPLSAPAVKPSKLQLAAATPIAGQLWLKQRALARSPLVQAAVSTADQPAAMEKVNLEKLQNGSDIRGVALEGVEGEHVNLTEAATEAIGAAFASFLSEKLQAGDRKLVISIGHDSRISADKLKKAAARGIHSAGQDVVFYGVVSSAGVEVYKTVDAEMKYGAIMITASHLPYNRNGLKFFTSKGGASKGDIADILARAASVYDKMSTSSARTNEREGSVPSVNYMERYSSDLVEAVRRGAQGKERPLDGFHILVDAGNGAGGFFAGSVLEPLGAITTGSQFLDPDGMFPNHIPNPEDKKAMAAVTKAVLDNKADLGIIFDTDVDRAAAVDSGGSEINRNGLIALMAAIVLEQHPGTTIVTDSVTSDGLTNFIEKKLGGKHHRFKRGYKNVIDEGVRLNASGEECHLAIETSGHGAMQENHWLDDGAYLMVKLLIKLAAAAAAGEGKGSEVLTRMIADLEQPGYSTEMRFKINQDHKDIPAGGFKEYGQQVLVKLEELLPTNPQLQKAPVNHEGVRVSGYGGWFLLRLSLHDPVLPLNVEAPSEAEARKLADFVRLVVKAFPALDVSSLDNLLSTNS